MQAKQVKQPSVLLVTVTPVESRAVLAECYRANKTEAKAVQIGAGTYQDLGILRGVQIYMALSEMGSGGVGGSQESVRNALDDIAPQALIMVGIAFGIDASKQAIGEVLIANQVLLYELQRVGAEKNISRGDKSHASQKLIQFLRHAALTWDESRARLDFGLLLSGEKLVDHLDFRSQLQAFAPEACGGEMEGAGLYAACHNRRTDWIIVKAICDFADGNKGQNKKANQELAAANAAAFVVSALQTVPLFAAGNDAQSPTIENAGPQHTHQPASPPAAPKIANKPLPSAIPLSDQLSSLLAWCDRAEVLHRLEEHLKNEEPLAGLLCLVDHARNRPDRLRQRVEEQLREKLPNKSLKTVIPRNDYGFDTVERFGKTMLEACEAKSEADLLKKMRAEKQDAIIIWHTDDCTRWDVATMRRFFDSAHKWLLQWTTLQQGAQSKHRLVLTLIARYDDLERSMLDKILKRPEVRQKISTAFQKASSAAPSFRHMTLGDLLVLQDYSTEDFRRWLNRENVRTVLQNDHAIFDDEDLIKQFFPNGSNRYTELLKLLEQHSHQDRKKGGA